MEGVRDEREAFKCVCVCERERERDIINQWVWNKWTKHWTVKNVICLWLLAVSFLSW